MQHKSMQRKLPEKKQGVKSVVRIGFLRTVKNRRIVQGDLIFYFYYSEAIYTIVKYLFPKLFKILRKTVIKNTKLKLKLFSHKINYSI